MSLDIDEFIRKHIDRIFVSIDQERNTLINALMSNTDILIDKCAEWFGSENPEEYNRVIRSLFTLANFLIDNRTKFEDYLDVAETKEIILNNFIERTISELIVILEHSNYKINLNLREENTAIVTSENILKESLYNIFFSLYPLYGFKFKLQYRFRG